MPDTRVNVTVEPLSGAGEDYKVETMRPNQESWDAASTAVLRPGLGPVSFPLNEGEALVAYPASLTPPEGSTYALISLEEFRCVQAFRAGRISITTPKVA